jgi:chemotaxis protein CheC
MALTNFDSLNPMHFDVLTELGNIGSGNAANALSNMTQQKIQIKVPEVSVLKFNEVVQFFGGAETLAAGLLVSLSENIEGMILYLFGNDFVNEILNVFFGKQVDNLITLDDMDKSAMLEIGNIMAASYVNAISQMTGLFIDISVPDLSIDMAGAMLAVPAIEFANIGDSVLFINDTFIINNKEVDSHMILVPTIESLTTLFSKLGVSI